MTPGSEHASGQLERRFSWRIAAGVFAAVVGVITLANAVMSDDVSETGMLIAAVGAVLGYAVVAILQDRRRGRS